MQPQTKIQNIKLYYFQNIVEDVGFTHKQMHFFILKNIKIYIKIHINIAPKCFGLRPSCCSMLPHNRIINNDIILPKVLT